MALSDVAVVGPGQSQIHFRAPQYPARTSKKGTPYGVPDFVAGLALFSIEGVAFQGKRQTDHILSHALSLSFSPGSGRAIDIEPLVFDCPQNKYYNSERNKIYPGRGSMNIFLRAGAILLKPKEEWIKIKDVPTTVQHLFTQYAMILAAIAAISRFIGNGLVGYKNPYIRWERYPIDQAILKSILYYIFLPY